MSCSAVGSRPTRAAACSHAGIRSVPRVSRRQITELVLQLRNEAGPRQVPNVNVALAQNGGGWHDGDNVAHIVHIRVR